MELRQIKLENIRSYINSKIDFPLGSVLLSGDIGSGKSSILHAIDFALFGIRKGDLTGASLLRSGEKKGFVELCFRIDDKEVIVKRTLKREKDTVVQDSGSITINTKKEDLSPLELKQRVIELLNYPKESLTKSKSLIYHYTVYTPQEEVKQILLGEKEIRINTLRKIFGIDKYQRISDNTKLVLTLLKERKKELQARTLEFDTKTQRHQELLQKSDIIKKELEELSQKVNQSYLLLEEKETQVKELEQKIKIYTKDKSDFELIQSKINSAEREIKYLEESIAYLKVEDLPEDQKDTKHLLEQLDSNNKEQQQLQEQIEKINYEITKNQIEKINSEKIIKDFESLKKCPVCLQDVDDHHKHDIITPHMQTVQKTQGSLQDLSKEQSELKQKQQDLRKKQLEALDEIKKIELQNQKIKANNYQKQQRQLNQKNLKEARETLIFLEQNLNELSLKVLKNKDIENLYITQKSHLQNIQRIQKEIEIKYNTQKVTLIELSSQIDLLQKEIEILRQIKSKIQKIENISNFLDADFLDIISDIEKNVMLRVHSDFSSLFERWFEILVDPQNLQVKLDEEFSPVIEQNGYNLDYLYLSGGEKTAVALAYRLALNQVINNLLSTIKTKDLIILDEPTDGFSSEQLDRLRILFEELNIKQTILVSHEPKIESFVQTVIRLSKKDHSTTLI